MGNDRMQAINLTVGALNADLFSPSKISLATGVWLRPISFKLYTSFRLGLTEIEPADLHGTVLHFGAVQGAEWVKGRTYSLNTLLGVERPRPRTGKPNLVGECENERKSGHLRALLLSNCATTLVKVLLLINPSSSRQIWLLQLSRHDDALIDTEACLLLQPVQDTIADFWAALEQAEFESIDADVCAFQGELKQAEA
ncbi:hypothetical protein BGW80DRAFT_1448248 [Lactifluus volemus]|nr:hypothetical protein BGW80DRAFT_1448248 [Lactifluus volemus]